MGGFWEHTKKYACLFDSKAGGVLQIYTGFGKQNGVQGRTNRNVRKNNSRALFTATLGRSTKNVLGGPQRAGQQRGDRTDKYAMFG